MNYYTNLEGKSLQNMNKNFFEEIKIFLYEKTSLKDIDDRDCAMFFGLWWKFAYIEGKPSKEMVFNYLFPSTRSFSAEDFYQKAKEGGKTINLKWIQKENTLYFRTLLLQGGIPLENLAKYGIAYRNFLLKVIEERPDTIAHISNNFDITKHLPISTRNDVIFEAALNISKAVWDRNEEGLRILSILEQNQQELVLALKDKKKEIEKKFESQIRIKTYWELTRSDLNSVSIVLKTDLPDIMLKDKFAKLIETNDNELSNSYNFFCDDTLLATYRKNIKGDFLKYSSSSSAIKWNPENEQFPLLYFSDNSGKKYLIHKQVTATPSTNKPSFWVQMEENLWIMVTKNNHNEESIYVLTKDEKHCTEPSSPINIYSKPFYFFEINQSTTFQISDQEYITFKLKTNSFDWYIQSKKPNWIEKTNMIVVESLPQIYFYEENGIRIQDNHMSKEWRMKGAIQWQNFHEPVPVGIIELKFCYNNEAIEYDLVFNIGNAQLQFLRANLLKPQIRFKHNSLKIEIIPNDLLLIETDKTNPNDITLSFLQTQKIPNRIKSYLKSTNGNLIFDLAMPLSGIELIDKDETIIANNHVFLLNKLDGNRIICGEHQVIKIYNAQYPKLIIHQNLQPGLIPLRNFHSIFQKLFLLGDVMAVNNVVWMETKEKRFQFKRYNCKISFKNEDGTLSYTQDEAKRLLVKIKNNNTQDFDNLLYAVPINCDINAINEIKLETCENGFCFPLEIKESEFIVFDIQNDSNYKIIPSYVTTSPYKLVSDQTVLNQKKTKRISEFADKLNQQNINGDDWKILNKYIQFCIQFKLPFSAFDNIRAACSSSELTAKLLFFLICYSENTEELTRKCVKLEEELGFKFHWSSFKSFEDAFDWIVEAIGMEIIPIIIEMVSFIVSPKYFNFQKNNWNLPNGFNLKTATTQMRMVLREAVINELPSRSPWMNDNRKNLISLDINVPPRLKIMTSVPTAIGLLKLDLYNKELPEGENVFDLWHLNNYEVRRNMIYCENLDPEWYDLAVTYVINKI